MLHVIIFAVKPQLNLMNVCIVITLLSLPLQPGPIHCPFYANSPPWTPTVTPFSWTVSFAFGGTPFHLKFCQLPAKLLLDVCCIILYVLISLVCIYLFPCVVVVFLWYTVVLFVFLLLCFCCCCLFLSFCIALCFL